MKCLKMLGLAVVAAMALMAVTAGSASATALEVGGTTKNEAVTITASLKSGTSANLKDTYGLSIDTCAEAHMHATTEAPFIGATVTGAVSILSFNKCNREPVVLHKGGKLHIAWTSGTNGTVNSSGAEWTVPSPYGTLNCKTGAGTHLGTLTGVKEGHATLDVNAVLSCSGISTKLEATYVITSPTGLGVSHDTGPSTTLEVKGVAKNEAVTIASSLTFGTAVTLKDTFGILSNSCIESHMHGTSEPPYSGPTVTGAVTTLTFSKCTREPVVVHKGGKLHIAWTSATNGTVTSSGAEVTTGSPFGTLNCKTGAGTHLGTLTGVKEGHATLDVNAALTCGAISSKWEGYYTVTSPTGLGVGS